MDPVIPSTPIRSATPGPVELTPVALHRVAPDPRADWLRELPGEGWEALAERLGLPAYRGRQIRHWALGLSVRTFKEMTDLPRTLRERLDEETRIGGPILAEEAGSDGVRKILYGLDDGEGAEAVSLPHPYGRSVCISSQVGCKMACAFCASGLLGFGRNLSAAEIVGQVVALSALAPEDRVRRVVFMGMGEPLDNLAAVVWAIRFLTDSQGFGLSQRHVTLSTSGLVPRVENFMKEGLKVRLAISLHSAVDEVRRSLMPVARAYDLSALADVARRYTLFSGHRVTYEYALIRDVNDTPQALEALKAFLRKAPGHVNLIPLNHVPETGLLRSRPERRLAFQDGLLSAGFSATFRRELGGEIDAACGQLRRRALGGRVGASGLFGDHDRHAGRPTSRAERGLGPVRTPA